MMIRELSPDSYLQISETMAGNQGRFGEFQVLEVTHPFTPLEMEIYRYRGERDQGAEYTVNWPVAMKRPTVEAIMHEAGSYFEADDVEFVAHDSVDDKSVISRDMSEVTAVNYDLLRVDTPALSLVWADVTQSPDQLLLSSGHYSKSMPLTQCR